MSVERGVSKSWEPDRCLIWGAQRRGMYKAESKGGTFLGIADPELDKGKGFHGRRFTWFPGSCKFISGQNCW